MKLFTVIGARPQFIKAATVSRELKKNDIAEVILHTGQHYDTNMSEIFFNELHIPLPKYNLGVGSFSHGKQTALMLEGIEKCLLDEKPDCVLIYGDTNSTLAGALAASKLHIKTAHVEAGLRSFNKSMPEEINRIVADHTSDILYAPTVNAINLLTKEGLNDKAFLSGDVMYDAVLFNLKRAEEKYLFNELIDIDKYYLATIHRQENTDNEENLQNIFTSFSEMSLPVVIPLHPRTRNYLSRIKYNENVKIINPVGYLEMLILLKNSVKVMTDSGGLQKEAYFLGKPCLTLRTETEWIETLDNNWNFIVGTDINLIREKIAVTEFGQQTSAFGDGKAAEKIAIHLLEYLSKI